MGIKSRNAILSSFNSPDSNTRHYAVCQASYQRVPSLQRQDVQVLFSMLAVDRSYEWVGGWRGEQATCFLIFSSLCENFALISTQQASWLTNEKGERKEGGRADSDQIESPSPVCVSSVFFGSYDFQPLLLHFPKFLAGKRFLCPS